MISGIRDWVARPVLRTSSDPADVESVTVRRLMYVLLPAWFVPGLADCVRHRRTKAMLATATAAAAAHEATAIWDVRSAVDGGREVRRAEQGIHSFLESLPFMAVSAAVLLVARVRWRYQLGIPPSIRPPLGVLAFADVHAVDLGLELGQRVRFGFALAPVIAVRPVAREFLHGR
jgi:hypothetical protein